ncbi:chitin synthase chs-2-like [Saccostrea cucullata]|uniref:chitin synthase chs-2-like n=1 Tax=Saccostrea cuccullata TaxID=36930 RepID=UPI002ED5A7E8
MARKQRYQVKLYKKVRDIISYSSSSNGKVPHKSESEKKIKKSGETKKQPENEQNEYWDLVDETPPISSDDSDTCWNIFTKIGVILFSITLFFIVLVSTGLTRIIIHLMIWKLNPPQANSTTTIDKMGGLLRLVEERTYLKYNCTQNSNNTDCASSFLQREDFPTTWECVPVSRHLCQLLEETPSVNVMWIWGLVIVMVVPDIYTIILSLWRLCFKETQKCDFKRLILSLVVETLHTTGLCLLVFLVLPAFDPITASILSCLIIFFPVVFSLFCDLKFSGMDIKTMTQKVANSSCIEKTESTERKKDIDIEKKLQESKNDSDIKKNCPRIKNSSSSEKGKDSKESKNESDIEKDVPEKEKDSKESRNEPDIEKDVQESRNVSGNEKEKELPVSKNEDDTKFYDVVFNITQKVGFVFFLISLGFAGWYIYKNSGEENFALIFCLLIISLVLVSITYWENFLMFSSTITLEKDTNQLKSIKSRLKTFLMEYIRSKRELVSLFTALWKVVLSISFPYIIFSIMSTDDSTAYDTAKAISLFGTSKVKTLTGKVILESRSYFPYGCGRHDLDALIIICVVLGFVGFKSARFACRVNLQYVCFSSPLVLSWLGTPLLIIPVMKHPLFWTTQDCNIVQPLWELRGTFIKDIWQLIVSGCFGFVACILLTLYVWTNNGSKLVKCDRLFRKPPYCGIFLNTSLLLTRCKDTTEQRGEEKSEEAEKSTGSIDSEKYYRPFVYFCATMWHETETEMTQLLKSIFKVDYEQFIQKEHEKTLKAKKKSYINEDVYQFEVHIFFDDAFKPRMNKTGTKQLKGIEVNDYVKTLESVIPKTAKSIYGGFELDEVKRYETPYGARFEWELLTSQKLVVHLKDKTKIRNRKRWSQVMYLFYLLSFKMNETKENEKEKLENSGGDLEEIMKSFTNNTFILALDGDVDFKPEAVSLLLDRMKKNPLVGAACGRIHPIGSGPMVWYQTFEYAVSHWLQKATEHVFGCVLCSPGCFSLFRGSALLANNVMKTYTKVPTEAAHHVQYDQGEDRWLCTLLLKQKYRVEYCAASDALTFAPEGFYEFYNQRRRWAPSTMANILDLLLDGNNVRKTNQNISRPYIFYHICLFISSILTPGTIFLLILGAIITAFPQIEPWLALLLNGVPVAIFIISIYVAKEETQLLFAAILSTLYSLVMLVVLIGLLKEGVEAQFCSVTTVFFCFVAGVFVIAAILHPKEFTCILHGLLYFLAVPSMSMLLIFYSVGNLHNVNWGTRESKTAKKDDSSTQKIKKRVLGQSCSFGDWCRCILCFNEIEDVGPGVSEEERKLEEKRRPKEIKKRGIFRKCNPIQEDEQDFWRKFIKKYLKPLKINDEEKSKMQAELIELRNKVFFFYFITNAIFVTIVYVLTQVNAYQKTLSIPLPCSVGETQGVIEPISIAFTLVFGTLLLIQFFGMLTHRVSTISHIVAATKIINKELDRKIPIKKFEKPIADAVKEEKKKTKNVNITKSSKWNTLSTVSTAVKILSGKHVMKHQSIIDLRNSIQMNFKLDTIKESTEEAGILKRYPEKPVPTMSIRNSPPPLDTKSPESSNQ